MATVRLRYVVSDIDRHGNRRFYLRMPGAKKVRLKEPVGTEAFVREYQDAVGKASTQPRQAVGSVRSVCVAYYQSSAFRDKLGGETQKVRRRILDGACEKIGHHAIRNIEERHVRTWMDARSGKPEAANGLLKALRGLFDYAKKHGHISRDPSAEVEKVISKTEGFHSWTVAEVERYEARHPVGTMARLAMALLLYLGQRRGDTVLMGRQHVEGNTIRVRQRKTGALLFLEILPELAAIIDATPCGDLTFLVTQAGRPFRSAASFGNKFRRWCNEAGLPQCSAHGLRKAGATRAAENGASDRQLMALFGWSKPEQATVYTRSASQKVLAASAAPLIRLGTKAQLPQSHSQVPPKKHDKKSIG